MHPVQKRGKGLHSSPFRNQNGCNIGQVIKLGVPGKYPVKLLNIITTVIQRIDMRIFQGEKTVRRGRWRGAPFNVQHKIDDLPQLTSGVLISIPVPAERCEGHVACWSVVSVHRVFFGKD